MKDLFTARDSVGCRVDDNCGHETRMLVSHTPTHLRSDMATLRVDDKISTLTHEQLTSLRDLINAYLTGIEYKFIH